MVNIKSLLKSQFFFENKVFSTYYTFFPKIKKTIQTTKIFLAHIIIFFTKKNINKKIVLAHIIGICLHSLGYSHLKYFYWF